MKKKEGTVPASAWTYLKTIMLSERYQTQSHILYKCLQDKSRTHKFKETRSVTAREGAWGCGDSIPN